MTRPWVALGVLLLALTGRLRLADDLPNDCVVDQPIWLRAKRPAHHRVLDRTRTGKRGQWRFGDVTSEERLYVQAPRTRELPVIGRCEGVHSRVLDR